MFEITVNNRVVDAEPGETILSALNRCGVRVPTLCHMENLSPTGACRICVVEEEGIHGLLPACSSQVQEGMRIFTNSPKVIRARRTILELLLANHPDDCLYCEKSLFCELRKLAEEYGIRRRGGGGVKREVLRDVTSPSIVRDSAKCILCGKCIRVCEEIQSVSAIEFVGRGCKTIVAPAFRQNLNVSSCVNCGQCTLVCPTGALHEKSSIRKVMDALADPKKIAVVQHAPSVSAALAEEVGLPAGTDVSGQLNAALRILGFQRVFDTSFSADLTVMEESAELIHRLSEGGVLPMFTSCSPAWVKFVEEFYPEFIPNLSTCKSPQGMLGAVIKTFYAEREKIDPKNIYSVSVMPCTAKKFEAERPELGRNNSADIDAVLTVRELGTLLRLHGIDFHRLSPEPADSPFGIRSTAGKLFGVSGGVMEAILRTAHKTLTGKELKTLKIESVRGLEGRKEAKIKLGGTELGVAVASGLGNARKLLESIKSGARKDLGFIEVMACPGGCVAGGGEPFSTDPESIRARMQALYAIDQNEPLRTSHDNPDVAKLYHDFFGSPNGARAIELLHTRYTKRNVYIEIRNRS